MTYQGISIVYMDNHALVAVKPPNMPSQADASGDPDIQTLLKNYVKEHYQKPGAVYLGLLHRLDRPVGGLMAFARTSKAAARLSEQLRTHSMRRSYHAVVQGNVPDAQRLEDTLQNSEGKNQHAILTYDPIAHHGNLSLLHVHLETGRKHQIRIQLAKHGLPIWGDARYGGGQPGQQIALWGTGLSFAHPTTKELLSFAAAPPDAFPWSLFDFSHPS